MAVEYAASVEQIIDRLNIMGFTLNASKAWFDQYIREELERYVSLAQAKDGEWAQSQVEILRTLTFEKYLHALSDIFDKKIVSWTSM